MNLPDVLNVLVRAALYIKGEQWRRFPTGPLDRGPGGAVNPPSVHVCKNVSPRTFFSA